MKLLESRPMKVNIILIIIFLLNITSSHSMNSESWRNNLQQSDYTDSAALRYNLQPSYSLTPQNHFALQSSRDNLPEGYRKAIENWNVERDDALCTTTLAKKIGITRPQMVKIFEETPTLKEFMDLHSLQAIKKALESWNIQQDGFLSFKSLAKKLRGTHQAIRSQIYEDFAEELIELYESIEYKQWKQLLSTSNFVGIYDFATVIGLTGEALKSRLKSVSKLNELFDEAVYGVSYRAEPSQASEVKMTDTSDTEKKSSLGELKDFTLMLTSKSGEDITETDLNFLRADNDFDEPSFTSDEFDLSFLRADDDFDEQNISLEELDFNQLRNIRMSGDVADEFNIGNAKNENEPKEAEVAHESKTEILKNLEDFLKNNHFNESISIFNKSKKYKDFCGLFRHTMTRCQIKALEDILNDLNSNTVMSRFLFGDVGFGKTEVALRAAFLMLLSGKKVILVTPRTTLADQHFKNFSKRLKGFFSVYRVLPDFHKNPVIKSAMESGDPAIFIGTQALNSQDKVRINDIGLHIIDESQTFGVENKRSLNVQNDNKINTLYMSATPQPRTISMIKEGKYSLSLLNTPPVGRKNVQTHLLKGAPDALLQSIIQKETARNGNIFIVTSCKSPNNKGFYDVETLTDRIQRLVPQKSIFSLTGDTANKNQIMQQFNDTKGAILVSTSVIEVGIDVSHANTMLIFDASRFGLAQIHQLRGRVGRSHAQGYCYLVDNFKNVFSIFKLGIFDAFGSIGSGFKISIMDSIIRGNGTMGDVRQHGQATDLNTSIKNFINYSNSSFYDSDLPAPIDILQNYKENIQNIIKSKTEQGDIKDLYEKLLKHWNDLEKSNTVKDKAINRKRKRKPDLIQEAEENNRRQSKIKRYESFFG